MTNSDLKEYLSIVVDMEKNIHLQTKAQEDFRLRLESLGKANFSKKEPREPVYKKTNLFGNLLQIFFGGAALIIGIALLFGCITEDIRSGFVAFLAWGTTIFCIGLGIILIAGAFEKLHETDAQNQNAQAEYEQQKSIYENELAEEKTRLQREEVEALVIKESLTRLETQMVRSQQNLKSIYEIGIIHPKYRNMICVCSLYEYLSVGLCSELEGHEGAYKILEQEILANRIITRLDAIVSSLQTIQRNQYIMFQAIQETNYRLEQIQNSLQNITAELQISQTQSLAQNELLMTKFEELQKSSLVTAYCAERAQKELHYLNRMNYLSGRNDGVVFNYPPT